MEIHVEETLFSVHINPYFLRLNFPYPVLEDDDSTASYDPSSGTLTVRLTKETKGTHYPDLDLLAKLLAPRPADQGRAKGPLIEVLDNTPDTLATELDDKLRLDLEQEHAVFARGAPSGPLACRKVVRNLNFPECVCPYSYSRRERLANRPSGSR